MANQTVSDAADALRQSCPGPVADFDRSCPIETALAVLRRRWTALVIGELLHGRRSFSELARSLPRLSDKVLAERLAQLTEAGVLDRHRMTGWPAQVTYTLTERGWGLATVLHALLDWGLSTPAAQHPHISG